MAATGIEDIGTAGGGVAGGAVFGMDPTAATGGTAAAAAVAAAAAAAAAGGGVGAGGASAALVSSLAGASATAPASTLQMCIPGVTVEPSSTISSMMTPEQGEFTGMEVCNTPINK